MPYFDYECPNENCDYYRADVEHPANKRPQIICPLCGTRCVKVYGPMMDIWDGGKPSSEN